MKQALLLTLAIGSLLCAQTRAQASTLLRWEQLMLRDEIDMTSPFQFLLGPDQLPEHPEMREAAFTQKLDPSNPADTRTFQQRYFVSSTYASAADSPVIYYICGEAECTTRFATRYAGSLAKTLHAHLVALEHRYYGKSQPFADYSLEHLKYLKTDYALEDLAAFERYAIDHLGLKGKWIVVGGSYAGSLSAYYRLKHPELVAGALASSAPVEARNNYEEFDYHATVAAGPACANAVRSIIAQTEIALAHPDQLAALKKKFSADAIEDPTDFVYLLSDLAAESVQYGKRKDLCAALAAGSQDLMGAYATYVQNYLSWFGATAVSFTPQGGLDPQASPDNNARPWFYQSCAEYGYWQNAYHDSAFSMRSPAINAAYHAGICKRLFGLEEADDTAMNRTHYLPLLDSKLASRIFFTNGSEDPWSELSISVVRGNDKNTETPVYWIDGGSHCSDLRAGTPGDSDSLNTARQKFTQLVSEWIR